MGGQHPGCAGPHSLSASAPRHPRFKEQCFHRGLAGTGYRNGLKTEAPFNAGLEVRWELRAREAAQLQG